MSLYTVVYRLISPSQEFFDALESCGEVKYFNDGIALVGDITTTALGIQHRLEPVMFTALDRFLVFEGFMGHVGGHGVPDEIKDFIRKWAQRIP